MTNVIVRLVTIAFLTASFSSSTAWGAMLVDTDFNGHLSPRMPMDAIGIQYTVSLDPLVAPAGAFHIGAPTPAEIATLGFAFLGWNFIVSPVPAPGEFDLVHYDADLDKSLPHEFEVDYFPGPQGPPGAAAGESLHWVQLVYTNDPCKGGLPVPYVDPECMPPDNGRDDNLPFYWTLAELPSKVLPGGGLQLTDEPSRPLIDATKLPGGVDWFAHSYIATWNNSQGAPLVPPVVTLYDGLEWGFDTVCSGAGFGTNQRGGVGGDKVPSEDQGSATGISCCS